MRLTSSSHAASSFQANSPRQYAVQLACGYSQGSRLSREIGLACEVECHLQSIAIPPCTPWPALLSGVRLCHGGIVLRFYQVVYRVNPVFRCGVQPLFKLGGEALLLIGAVVQAERGHHVSHSPSRDQLVNHGLAGPGEP